MNGLKLIAAALCGSALTLGLTTFAQAPKRTPATMECSSTLSLIESDVAVLNGKLDRIAAAQDQAAADQRLTLDRTGSISSDLRGIESSLLNIELRERFR